MDRRRRSGITRRATRTRGAGRDHRDLRPRGVLLLPHERGWTTLAIGVDGLGLIGAVVLTTGALVFFSAIVGNFSQSWLIATGHYRGRMIEYGVWASGALIIGLGVLPVVAAPRGSFAPRTRRGRPSYAPSRHLLAALLCFGLYTAVRRLYLSTSFGTVIVERNLIYVIPRSSSSAPPSGSNGRGCAGSPGGGHRPRGLPARSPTTRSRTSRTRTHSGSPSPRCPTATSRLPTAQCSGSS